MIGTNARTSSLILSLIHNHRQVLRETMPLRFVSPLIYQCLYIIRRVPLKCGKSLLLEHKGHQNQHEEDYEISRYQTAAAIKLNPRPTPDRPGFFSIHMHVGAAPSPEK